MTMHGNKPFQIEYLISVAKEDIPSLPKNMKKSIKTAIEERIAVDPIGFGKPLQYSFRGHRRLRVGDYRIIYRIEEKTKTVLIIAIKHRKETYER